ncbi:tRNA synthetases class I (M)-domain-containing protein [Apiosordaria backusii]|uniref:methionine--tRNA ligase n=1 Tax=Apiosordaria backusii TaxID=314023 RepID=A0AA40EYZ8_9PEZI|nr:tRNA synthetases class I (M)-domain-containing protein [Apiosordaria backusii]
MALHPPLPKPGERNMLITSALPYVNNIPHLGNIIGSVLSADVFARYCRSRSYNTLFVGGTDEFGTTTSLRAREEGTTPAALCDKYHAVHEEVYRWFGISFDIFGRTTNEEHTKITQDVFRELWEKGAVKEQRGEQLWCEKCDGFVFDRLVEGGCPGCGCEKARGDQCGVCGCLLEPVELVRPRCKLDGAVPVRRESKHLFLDVERLKPELEKFLVEKGGKWSENAKEVTRGMMEGGVRNWCITRDGLDWGTPVPEWLEGYEGKVFYPWWDALLGYVSITAAGMKGHEWERWWKSEKVHLYQFLGADNIPFHTLLLPATLLAASSATNQWTILHHLSATNYLTYQGGKFSKSLGVGVFGDSARETGLSADIFRFYLLYSRPEHGTDDKEFTWDGLIRANNELLVGRIGRFIKSVMKGIHEDFSGVVPDWRALPTDPSSENMKLGVEQVMGYYVTLFEGVILSGGLRMTLEMADSCNTFLLGHRLCGDAEVDGVVIWLGVNLVYLLAGMLEPYLPDTAAGIFSMLRVERPVGRLEECWNTSVKPGHEVGRWEEVDGLFEYIKPEKAREWEAKFGGRKKREGKMVVGEGAKKKQKI